MDNIQADSRKLVIILLKKSKPIKPYICSLSYSIVFLHTHHIGKLKKGKKCPNKQLTVNILMFVWKKIQLFEEEAIEMGTVEGESMKGLVEDKEM